MSGRNRVIIEKVKPQIDQGKYPIKRVINDVVHVEADIFCDGHDAIRAELLYKHFEDKDWNITELEHSINDIWSGKFVVDKRGNYIYTIRAWIDRIKTWNHDILKKIDAEVEIQSDIAVGRQLIERVLNESETIKEVDKAYLEDIERLFSSRKSDIEKIEPIINKKLYTILRQYPLRDNLTQYSHELTVISERPKAGFSSWYEFFPRSVPRNNNEHGTFKDAIKHLQYVSDLGFDVVYLPPIHPIGETKRKGKNNNPQSEPGEPGSPWAIGSKDGGHKSIHKQLGTLDDFKEFVAKANEYNIDVALDIALQCSPDHPYVKEHPEWFRHRPDGTIQYAENPPKKYEDIYPFDFESDNWEEMWQELKSIFTFWVEQGVNVFRVDNPHTKSLRFWGWLIDEIHKINPDVIFLAEAFTRPKVMYQLAKRGFTQSYTYFTWRNTKWELTKYFKELVNTEVGEFFRPNLWPNTPDILPEFLQVSGRTGFVIRTILAATLSSSYGIYGPAFELMENIAKDFGGEEYLNSEKYEIKDWDYSKKTTLRPVIKQLNKLRHDNPALHNNHTLRFHETENENIIAYSKHTDDLSNIILTIVNLDPHHTHHGWIHFPEDGFKLKENETYQVHDLLGGAYFLWGRKANYVELNPGVMPAHVLKVRRKMRTEYDFDYFM